MCYGRSDGDLTSRKNDYPRVGVDEQTRWSARELTHRSLPHSRNENEYFPSGIGKGQKRGSPLVMMGN